MLKENVAKLASICSEWRLAVEARKSLDSEDIDFEVALAAADDAMTRIAAIVQYMPSADDLRTPAANGSNPQPSRAKGGKYGQPASWDDVTSQVNAEFGDRN
ncbi:MAG: hypothetical protein EOS36_07325 [Mesorhizobium sp.]|uniref:hypothetical protein n=1 Tax=Mesorhizobium sp. TaxID=1871066 RepID=UPI000FE71FFD|nr:hypothetical protein [Mesorhizobium sp.]RWD65505.1 MAG: hypothetical protein EOS36_07325 [Mesorhizobium sp.]